MQDSHPVIDAASIPSSLLPLIPWASHLQLLVSPCLVLRKTLCFLHSHPGQVVVSLISDGTGLDLMQTRLLSELDILLYCRASSQTMHTPRVSGLTPIADVCSTAVFSACRLFDHKHDGFFSCTTSASLHVPWIVQHLTGQTLVPTE